MPASPVASRLGELQISCFSDPGAGILAYKEALNSALALGLHHQGLLTLCWHPFTCPQLCIHQWCLPSCLLWGHTLLCFGTAWSYSRAGWQLAPTCPGRWPHDVFCR